MGPALSPLESLYREASRRFGRERAEGLRPFIEQLARDIELLARVSFDSGEEPR